MYQRMKDKPATFLQLLWRYESMVTRGKLAVAQPS